MIKKTLLFIFMYAGCLQMAFCDELIQVFLTCSYDESPKAKGGIKRSPARMPIAVIEGTTVTFPAFPSDCTFEVVDASTEEVAYSQYIIASDTSRRLPSGMSGEYIIRFVFEHYTLEGNMELR